VFHDNEVRNGRHFGMNALILKPGIEAPRWRRKKGRANPANQTDEEASGSDRFRAAKGAIRMPQDLKPLCR
jgi:hypothetical protein